MDTGSLMKAILQDADIMTAPVELLAGVTFRLHGIPMFLEGPELERFRKRPPDGATEIVFHWDLHRAAELTRIYTRYVLDSARALLD